MAFSLHMQSSHYENISFGFIAIKYHIIQYADIGICEIRDSQHAAGVIITFAHQMAKTAIVSPNHSPKWYSAFLMKHTWIYDSDYCKLWHWNTVCESSHTILTPCLWNFSITMFQVNGANIFILTNAIEILWILTKWDQLI